MHREEILEEITGDKVMNERMNNSKCVVMECNGLPGLDDVGVERLIRAVPFTVASYIYNTLQDKTGFILANPFYKTPEFQLHYR